MPAQTAGAINTSMGGGSAPGMGSKQDQSIETLLAEFQAAPSISLGDLPTLDESFLRQTDDGAQSMPTFGRGLQPQDSAYILTPLLPSSAFGGSLGKSSSDTHHSGDASEGEDEAPAKLPAGKRARGAVGEDEAPAKLPAGKRARGSAARAQRTADKNRQAQKRYRERQKDKMAEFERQVEELSGRVSSLMQEKMTLETRNSLLERVVQLKQETDSERSEQFDERELAMYRSMTLFRNLLTPLPCNVKDAARLSHDDIVEIYGMYVSALMECMRGPVDDMMSPSYQRLRQLIEAHRDIMLHMGRVDAKMVSKIHCTLKKQVAPPGTWARCVESMGLSGQQRGRILQARQTLLTQMGDILQRRREIIQSLQGLLPESPSALSEQCKSFHSALTASDELRESLEAEHHAVGEFIAAIYAPDLLTPVQEARMSIEAAPFKVDTLAVSNQVAAEAGPPPVDCFMTELSGLLECPQSTGPLMLMPASSAFRNLSVPEAPPILFNAGPVPLT